MSENPLAQAARAFLRFDLSGETRSGDLGAGYWDQVASDEKFPGVSVTGDPGDFPDPDVPARPRQDETIDDLLRQIRDRLPNNQNPDQVWVTQVQTLTLNAGERIFRHIPDWRYFYVANPTTRAISVYLGAGQSLFLGAVPAGRTMRGEVPFDQDSIYITWGAGGTATEQITVMFASAKIDVSII